MNLLVFLTPRIIYDAKTLTKISEEKKALQQKLLVPPDKSNFKDRSNGIFGSTRRRTGAGP